MGSKQVLFFSKTKVLEIFRIKIDKIFLNFTFMISKLNSSLKYNFNFLVPPTGGAAFETCKQQQQPPGAVINQQQDIVGESSSSQTKCQGSFYLQFFLFIKLSFLNLQNKIET